jgi:hypothetical protein
MGKYKTPSVRDAVKAIDREGILLTFPISNKKEPASLWSSFHPRSEMRWEWDSGGDNRVADLWHLREELSRSGKVVYAKWFRGRATFFSRGVFPALLKSLNPVPGDFLGQMNLGQAPLRLLRILEGDSPLSTKDLKKSSGLKGRLHEGAYAKALKVLWERLLIVGYGEVDDGAFPSLAVGATRALFEDLWEEARSLSPEAARSCISRSFPDERSVIRKFLAKLIERPRAAPSVLQPLEDGERPYISFS